MDAIISSRRSMLFADLSGMMGSLEIVKGNNDLERQRSYDGTACTSVAKSRGTSKTGMPLNSQGCVISTRLMHGFTTLLMIRSAPQIFAVHFSRPVSIEVRPGAMSAKGHLRLTQSPFPSI
jgi:hypothetical protein